MLIVSLATLRLTRLSLYIITLCMKGMHAGLESCKVSPELIVCSEPLAEWISTLLSMAPLSRAHIQTHICIQHSGILVPDLAVLLVREGAKVRPPQAGRVQVSNRSLVARDCDQLSPLLSHLYVDFGQANAPAKS
jgi:hypothetical protein